MSKAILYVANTGVQNVPVDGIVSLGSTIRRFGCGVTLSGNGISITEPGYYEVNVSVTVAPTAAGDVTVALLNNGVAVPGATASATVAAANDFANLAFESIVRTFCNATTGDLTLLLTDTASSVTNVAVTVERL